VAGCLQKLIPGDAAEDQPCCLAGFQLDPPGPWGKNEKLATGQEHGDVVLLRFGYDSSELYLL